MNYRIRNVQLARRSADGRYNLAYVEPVLADRQSFLLRSWSSKNYPLKSIFQTGWDALKRRELAASFDELLQKQMSVGYEPTAIVDETLQLEDWLAAPERWTWWLAIEREQMTKLVGILRRNEMADPSRHPEQALAFLDALERGGNLAGKLPAPTGKPQAIQADPTVMPGFGAWA